MWHSGFDRCRSRGRLGSRSRLAFFLWLLGFDQRKFQRGGVEEEGGKLGRTEFWLLLGAGVKMHSKKSLTVHDGDIVQSILVEVAGAHRDGHGLLPDFSIRTQHIGVFGGCVDDAGAADAGPDIGRTHRALEARVLDEVGLCEDERGG